ncbi:hypothetical protein BUALT_Bualt12G0012100 [Buddleja alternifolia]|uniref:F-box domain-containing protein n=1 Tax=Buddleja alternifolia TaxID=168488 RepID=A0AAV6WUX9_9LAMI|nr:hypothetical protein BUALT_Bualt12G0012100 [Buddleja alternifolia]
MAGSMSGYGGNNSPLINEETVKQQNNLEVAQILLEDEEDRLSALPDPVLLHILSFLDSTTDVVRTTILAKRWRYLWTDVSKFDFCNDSQDTERIRAFVDWIFRTLILSCGHNLKKFRVKFNYQDCFASRVYSCVRFCIRFMVEDVTLDFSQGNYKLPPTLHFNSFLKKLRLRNCTIAPPQQSLEWKCLTSLSIEEVELSQSLLGIILSGCPVLEYLELTKCWGTSSLEFNTRSPKELVLRNWFSTGSLPLVISAPHLQFLSITDHTIGETNGALQLFSISSLVKANLHFKYCCLSTNVTDSVFMRELFESLQHVEELELGNWFYEVVSEFETKGWQLPQYACKCLTLNAFRCGESIPGILRMLESSPKLETLVINWSDPPPPPYKVSNIAPILSLVPGDPATSGDLNCDLLQLKMVKLALFEGPYDVDEPMLKLVQLLLKRARILEKIAIDVKEFMGSSSTTCSSNYSKISQTVLSYPRSSPKIVVQFCS